MNYRCGNYETSGSLSDLLLFINNAGILRWLEFRQINARQKTHRRNQKIRKSLERDGPKSTRGLTRTGKVGLTKMERGCQQHLTLPLS